MLVRPSHARDAGAPPGGTPGAVAGPGPNGASTPVGAGDATHPRRPRLNPHVLSYLMGPAALVALIGLRRLGVVAKEPVWLWLAVFVAIPATSLVVEALYRRSPTTLMLNARVACHAAAVTVVIYLTGWGPVLTGAFAFTALENVAHDGSRTWRLTALWSLMGIVVGQVAIWQGWAPSFLSVSYGEGLGLMGAFVLVFVVRMAGATMQQKEEAETSMRASEDRFRSLVQNSTDTTLVMGPEAVIIYASPATMSLLGRHPGEIVGMRATEARASRGPRPGGGAARLAAPDGVGDRAHPVPHGARGRDLPPRRGRGERPA